ncbi:Uncharacterized protein HZ326_2262 [Fusarium oxysporum f. sp. albedinis]|jgi:hypothetical protein|nr:Uncharacterized protein HZ326_2262 [Fusarium oxysporum f. sp. albedinis]
MLSKGSVPGSGALIVPIGGALRPPPLFSRRKSGFLVPPGGNLQPGTHSARKSLPMTKAVLSGFPIGAAPAERDRTNLSYRPSCPWLDPN